VQTSTARFRPAPWSATGKAAMPCSLVSKSAAMHVFRIVAHRAEAAARAAPPPSPGLATGDVLSRAILHGSGHLRVTDTDCT
jgi:hypothetical protein